MSKVNNKDGGILHKLTKYQCIYCVALESLDHLHPISKVAKHNNQLRSCCLSCNEKNQLEVLTWYRNQNFMIQEDQWP